DLSLHCVGIYPKKDEYSARLKKRFDVLVDLYFRDQPRAGPIAAVPVVQSVDNPIPELQTKVAEAPALDGVRLDDASFASDGKLLFHGIWVGNDQRRSLEKLVEQTLTDDHPALKRGIHWGSM